MQKLPVFATIAKAYGFVGREFATIIRLSWFPVLIGVAFQYVASMMTYRHFIDAMNGRRELDVTAYTA